MRFWVVCGSAAGALALASISTAAQAQASRPGAQSPSGSADTPADDTGALVDIVVTAQRRAESLQNAAIPINAATGADLLRVGVTDATALNRVAPSLYVTSGGGANAGYFVRGVGNFTNNGYTNPAVAFNIDGVYIGRPSSTIASFLDVGVVEVLKGPQGTLYGRNATGGAINVRPNTPQLGEFQSRIMVSYGNYNTVNVEGMVNVPVAEGGALRIAAVYNKRDGFNADGTSDGKDFAVRGQLYVEPSNDFNVRLSIDYSTQKGVGPGTNVSGFYAFASPAVPNRLSLPVPGYTFVAAPANVSAPYTGLHTPAALTFASTVAGAPLFSSFTGFAYPFRNDRYFGTNAEINLDVGKVKLVVIPAYRRSELNNQFNGPPFKAAINRDTAEQYSLEGRASGTTGPVDWLVGGFYFNEQVVGINAFNQFATSSNNRWDSRSKSLAFFGRSTINLSDSVRLVGGLRYTRERRSIDALATATTAVCRAPATIPSPRCPQVPTIPVGLTIQDSLNAIPAGLFPIVNPQLAFNPNGTNGVGQVFPYGPLNVFAGSGVFGPGALLIVTPNRILQSASESRVTYRLSAEFDITPDNLLYASFENGFRAGGFNIARGRENYDPEFIDAYTIGSKNRFFNNRLELNAELFYWKYRGQQLSALGVDIDGNNAFYTRNVGRSSIKGVDIDFQWLAAHGTRVRGGVQYLDAVFDSFVFNQRDTSAATDPANFVLPVTGCRSTQVLTPLRSFDVDCSGKQALNAPKWSANLGIEQTVDAGDLEVTATLDGRYRSGREVSFSYVPVSRIGGDVKFDAAVTVGPRHRGWSLAGFVQNLTNRAVLSIVQVGAGNIVGSVYEPPRTFGVRGTTQF